MKTLVIIFGQVRTLSTCIFSIYDKILLTNRPCQVILSIDGKYQDIPKDSLDLLSPFLLDIYVTHNKHNVVREHQIIEFFLVKEALKRVDINEFDFLFKIRTDIFIRNEIPIKSIYGMCSQQQFEKHFQQFISNCPFDWKQNLSQTIQSYVLTASIPFFINKQLDKKNPPVSPWSLKNIYEWNSQFLDTIDIICDKISLKNGKINIAYVHNLVRKLFQDFRVICLIGSTWIHFGYAKDVENVSKILFEKHTTMKWPSIQDDEIMKWNDHKNETRSMPQKDWMKITDDQIRMVHHLHGYTLVDLVNPDDYIESFDATNQFRINKKRPNLFAWIVREHSL